jgi:sugar phosphate isomerase/epimerase
VASNNNIEFGFRLHQEHHGCVEWAKLLLEAGFTWVEVQAPGNSDGSIEQILSKIASSPKIKRSVHSRFYGINLAALEPRIRNAAVECGMDDLHWAAAVRANTFVVHAGEMHWYDFPPKDHPCLDEFTGTISNLRREHLHAASESINKLAVEARAVGIMIAVENLYAPWELLCTPSDMAAFLDTVSPDVVCTLDAGHATIARNKPADYPVLLGNRIKHVHIHANDGLIDCHWAPIRMPEQSREWAVALAGLDPLPPLVMEVPTRNASECVDSMKMLKEMIVACRAKRNDVKASTDV